MPILKYTHTCIDNIVGSFHYDTNNNLEACYPLFMLGLYTNFVHNTESSHNFRLICSDLSIDTHTFFTDTQLILAPYGEQEDSPAIENRIKLLLETFNKPSIIPTSKDFIKSMILSTNCLLSPDKLLTEKNNADIKQSMEVNGSSAVVDELKLMALYFNIDIRIDTITFHRSEDLVNIEVVPTTDQYSPFYSEFIINGPLNLLIHDECKISQYRIIDLMNSIEGSAVQGKIIKHSACKCNII